MKDHLQSQGKICDFNGKVFVVELNNGLKAVFKDCSEDLGDAEAEVAAYQASVFLGFPNVPPTIIKEIEGVKGSFQLFVETTIDALKLKNYKETLQEAGPEDLANLNLFYFIFGQWDTGPHNILILKEKEKTHLVAIDNSGIRNQQHVKYGDLPFVRLFYNESLNTNDEDQPFPFDQTRTIGDYAESYLDKFPPYLKQNKRRWSLPAVIYQNGLWVQYHAGDEDFDKSVAAMLPEKTKEILEKLDLGTLKKIFTINEGKLPDFATDSHLKAILERWDQVLKSFNQKK